MLLRNPSEDGKGALANFRNLTEKVNGKGAGHQSKPVNLQLYRGGL